MASNPRFAGPSPFARLGYSQAASVAGDALVTVSLAGSLFFNVGPDAARGKVLLYLALTLAPFAVVAPLIAPVLDRTRGGRRLVIVLSAAGRAVLAVVMAQNLDGLLLYPAAFGILVLGKAHQIAKSALTPEVVDDEEELVTANSRLALIAVVAATVAGVPGAGIQHVLGADVSLFLAAAVFVMAAILAFKIPRAQQVAPDETPAERAELHVPSIQVAGSAMGVLRGSVGFLTFLLAFSLKADGQPAWFYGAVLVASVGGGALGVVMAPVIKRIMREEVLLACSLVVPAAVAVYSAWRDSRPAFMAIALAVAVGAAAGKIAFDSLLQRDGPDHIRGRAFARFETRFQLLWVIGALIPVAIPIDSRVGFFILAVGLGIAGISYLGAYRRAAEALKRREERMARIRDPIEASIRRRLRRIFGRPDPAPAAEQEQEKPETPPRAAPGPARSA
ncbi:MAG: MFS transporter [Acidimicrobiia bacterium]